MATKLRLPFGLIRPSDTDPVAMTSAIDDDNFNLTQKRLNELLFNIGEVYNTAGYAVETENGFPTIQTTEQEEAHYSLPILVKKGYSFVVGFSKTSDYIYIASGGDADDKYAGAKLGNAVGCSDGNTILTPNSDTVYVVRVIGTKTDDDNNTVNRTVEDIRYFTYKKGDIGEEDVKSLIISYGSGALMNDFVEADKYTSIETTDTIDEALGKLQKGIEENKESVTEINTQIANIKTSLTSVYRVKGSVDTYSNEDGKTSLVSKTSTAKIGDVWNVKDTDMNYVCVEGTGYKLNILARIALNNRVIESGSITLGDGDIVIFSGYDITGDTEKITSAQSFTFHDNDGDYSLEAVIDGTTYYAKPVNDSSKVAFGMSSTVSVTTEKPILESSSTANTWDALGSGKTEGLVSESSEDYQKLLNLIYTLSLVLGSNNSGNYEVGTAVTPSVAFTTKRGDDVITPDDVTVTKSGSVPTATINTAKNLLTGSASMASSSGTYTITATKGSQSAKASVSYAFYYYLYSTELDSAVATEDLADTINALTGSLSSTTTLGSTSNPYWLKGGKYYLFACAKTYLNGKALKAYAKAGDSPLSVEQQTVSVKRKNDGTEVEYAVLFIPKSSSGDEWGFYIKNV